MCLGIPACVIELAPSGSGADDDLKMATVEMGGIKKSVCIEHVADVGVGDWVLVHVGFALAVIDEREARKIFELLTELDTAMGGDLGADNDEPAAAPAVMGAKS